MKALCIISTILGTTICILFGGIFVFIEARMIIAGDFLAYGNPDVGLLAMIARMAYALIFGIILPILGIVLRKVSLLRLVFASFVIFATALAAFLLFQGDVYSTIIRITMLVGALLYMLSAILFEAVREK